MRLTVSGLTKTQKDIQAIAARMKSLKPALEAGAAELQKLISDSFRNGRSPDGKPFAPHKLSTILRRRGKGFRKILYDTGRLANSIAVFATDKTINVGINVVYGGIHQFGGVDGRGRSATIPARPFLPVVKSSGRYSLMHGPPVDKSMDRVRKYIADYVLRGKVRSG